MEMFWPGSPLNQTIIVAFRATVQRAEVENSDITLTFPAVGRWGRERLVLRSPTIGLIGTLWVKDTLPAEDGQQQGIQGRRD